MSVRRFFNKWEYGVKRGSGPDAPYNEPDNVNNLRPVYWKIKKKNQKKDVIKNIKFVWVCTPACIPTARRWKCRASSSPVNVLLSCPFKPIVENGVCGEKNFPIWYLKIVFFPKYLQHILAYLKKLVAICRKQKNKAIFSKNFKIFPSNLQFLVVHLVRFNPCPLQVRSRSPTIWVLNFNGRNSHRVLPRAIS